MLISTLITIYLSTYQIEPKTSVMSVYERTEQAIEPVEEGVEQVIEANVTAYTAIETCAHSSCIMANGKKAYVGAAACPRKYAFNTRFKIDGVGIFTCADRTAKKYDRRFDLFFGYEQSDYQRALNFGIKKSKIHLLHLN